MEHTCDNCNECTATLKCPLCHCGAFCSQECFEETWDNTHKDQCIGIEEYDIVKNNEDDPNIETEFIGATLLPRSKASIKKKRSRQVSTLAASPIRNIRIRVITWNTNGQSLNKNIWLDYFKNTTAIEARRGLKWTNIFLLNPVIDIYVFSLQEVDHRDQFGLAAKEMLNTLNPNRFRYQMVENKVVPNINKNFSQKMHIFIRNDLSAVSVKNKVCFGKGLGRVKSCLKASLITKLNIKGYPDLIFIGSHLPFNPKARDLGASKRNDAHKTTMKTMQGVLKVLSSKKETFIFWAGDLNYRRILVEDVNGKLVEKDQLTESIRKKTAFAGFNEQTINFAPSCKFDQKCVENECFECRNMTRLCRKTDKNCKRGVTDDTCYVEDRNPSHCDRILTAKFNRGLSKLMPQEYRSFYDGNAIHLSDHNMVYATFILTPDSLLRTKT